MSVAAAALALIALADPFCADVQKLAEGAKEPFPFQALKDADYMPMLLRNGCFPGGDGYFCQQSALPADITGKGMAERVAACLPGSKITVEKQPGSKPETVVTGSGARFLFEESEGKGSEAGRILRIQIVSDR